MAEKIDYVPNEYPGSKLDRVTRAMVSKTPELNKALVAARKAIKMPAMDSQNPHFGNKFASLKAIIDATVQEAAEHGIFVTQELVTIDYGVACYTHLLHESGEEKTFGPLIMRPTKNDPQGEASASTYARRYALQSVFTIVGDPDDDGNAASESAFGSKQAKGRARNELRKAALDNESDKARKLWNDLDNDQRAELWDSYSKDDRKIIEECLEVTR